MIRRSFFPKTIVIEFPFCAGPSLRLARFSLFVRTERRGVKTQAPESTFQVNLRHFSLFFGFGKRNDSFLIGVVSTVNPSTTSDGDVVCVNLPIGAETHLSAPTWGEDSVRSEREVFRAVGGPERQADREILPAPCEDG